MKILMCMFLCLTAGSVHAGSCGNLEDYEVQPTGFTRLPVEDAVVHIAKGTPFQIIMSGSTDTQVTADSISGSLNIVLNELAKTSNFTYTKEKCVIRITPKVKAYQWIARNGDDLKTTLADWARAAGWQVVFDDADMHFAIGADFQTSGDVEEAVASLLDAINGDARAFHGTFYYGNKVLRILRANSTVMADGEKQ